jgi:hypothetical protein
VRDEKWQFYEMVDDDWMKRPGQTGHQTSTAQPSQDDEMVLAATTGDPTRSRFQIDGVLRWNGDEIVVLLYLDHTQELYEGSRTYAFPGDDFSTARSCGVKT